MDEIAKLVALPAAQFAAVVALFLPGFVSLKVDRLIQPASPTAVGELVIEAFAYSLINAGLSPATSIWKSCGSWTAPAAS